MSSGGRQVESGEERGWLVLVVGGTSGAGKTTLAAELGLRFRVPSLQLDDLRLAFERTEGALSEDSTALRFFQQPDVWREPAPVLTDALIRAGAALEPALGAIIENHVDQAQPVIVEGDLALPSILDVPSVARAAARDVLRCVWLVEDNETEMMTALLERDRGFGGRTPKERETEVVAKVAFGRWLRRDAERRDALVLSPRPRSTLTSRVIEATRLDST